MFETEQPRKRSVNLPAATSAALFVVAAAVVVACGDGGAEGQVAASCENISQIQSYRYSINLKLDSPAFDQSPPQSGTSSGTPAPPLSAFAEALEALFSDLKLEGAYRAPNRTQVVLRFKGEELELREVDDKSWIRVGATWHQQDPAQEETILTPNVVCKDIVEEIAPSLNEVDSERDTVNNVEADHYRLDRADIKRLPELLGAGPETDLPDKFQVDVWLAREGRFPVRLDIGAEDKDEQGNPIGLSLFMEFRDLNDPGIAIEPPVLSPTGS
jgi:hypothetical protein